MTTFTKVFQSERRSRLNKPNIFQKFNFNTEKLSIAVFLALIVSGFTYLAVINSVSIRGFEIKALENRVEELREQNKEMQMEAASLKSMNTIAAGASRLKLTPSQEIEFVEVSAPYVAMGQ